MDNQEADGDSWSPGPLPERIQKLYRTQPYLDTRALARAFDYADRTVRKLVETGKLPHHLSEDGRRVFTRDDVLKFWNSEARWLIDDFKLRRRRRYRPPPWATLDG